jgi:hypothetical protein
MPTHKDAVYTAVCRLIEERQDVFAYFHDHKKYKRFGWEKWFQVELAHQLRDLGEPIFEVPHGYVKTVKVSPGKALNRNGFVDLEFRLDNSLRGFRAAIEIKIDTSAKGMAALMQDFKKIRAFSAAKSKWKYRSVIGVLAYEAPLEGARKTPYVTLINELEKSNQCRVNTDNPNFHFIVLGWEENATQRMIRENYATWLKKLAQTYTGVKARLRPTVLQRNLPKPKEK